MSIETINNTIKESTSNRFFQPINYIMYFIFRISWLFNTNFLFFVSFHNRLGPGRKPLSNNRKLFKNSRNFLRREIWASANCMDTWCGPKLQLARFFFKFFSFYLFMHVCVIIRLVFSFVAFDPTLRLTEELQACKLHLNRLSVLAGETKNADMNALPLGHDAVCSCNWVEPIRISNSKLTLIV